MFDVSLLDQIKEGNREAFNNLFRYYYPRVMAYTAAMVEQEVAEDIVQDVFYMYGKIAGSYMRERVFIPTYFNRLIRVVWII